MIIDSFNENGKYKLGNFENNKLKNIFTLNETKRIPMIGLNFEKFYEQTGIGVANLDGTNYLCAWGFTQFIVKYIYKNSKLVLNIVKAGVDQNANF